MPFLPAKEAREITKHIVDTARTGSKCFATQRRLLPRNRGELDLRRRGNVPRSLVKLPGECSDVYAELLSRAARLPAKGWTLFIKKSAVRA